MYVLVKFVQKTLEEFMNSGDLEITTTHVPDSVPADGQSKVGHEWRVC